VPCCFFQRACWGGGGASVLPDESAAQQEHWSAQGRAALIANADALTRLHRSVLAFYPKAEHEAQHMSPFILEIKLSMSNSNGTRYEFESRVVEAASTLKSQPVEMRFLQDTGGWCSLALTFDTEADTQFVATQTAKEIAKELQAFLSEHKISVSHFSAAAKKTTSDASPTDA